MVLGYLGAILGGLRAVFGGLGVVLGGLGAILGGLGAVFGRSWGHLGAVLGGSWSPQGRSKIDQKTDPTLDSKTRRIATEKNGPNTTPVVVSELETPQRKLDDTTRKSYQNRFRYD